MSDGRKEVRVRDLVIKADNVYFERPERNIDPFWGPRRRREELESTEEHEMEKDNHDEEGDDEENEGRRPPFFWI